MKRDFSEAKKNELYSTIDEINEQNGFSDFWGDLFTGDVDISSYVDRVDEYHKDYIDKNNTSKETIGTIFTDVNQEDSSYALVLQSHGDLMDEVKAYLDSLNSSFDSGIDGFTVANVDAILKGKAAGLTEALTDIYIAMLNRDSQELDSAGNVKEYDYDYDYLREVMDMNPGKVHPSLYAALFIVFNDMGDEDKSMFISNSYHEGEFIPFLNDGGYDVGSTNFKLSPVFTSMVIIMDYAVGNMPLDKGNHYTPEAQKFFGSYALLKGVAVNGQHVYVTTIQSTQGSYVKKPKVNVTVTNGSQMENDPRFTSSPYDFMVDFTGRLEGGTTITGDSGLLYTYTIKDGNSLDTIFDQQALNVSDTLRINKAEEIAETITLSVIDTAVGELTSKIPVVGHLYTATRTTIDVINIMNDPTNETLDQVGKLINDGNSLDALQLNTSVTFNDNGQYQVNYMTLNTEDLTNAMDAYKHYKDPNFHLTIEDVVNSIRNDNVADNPALMEYIQWYETENGEVMTEKYLDEVKNP